MTADRLDLDALEALEAASTGGQWEYDSWPGGIYSRREGSSDWLAETGSDSDGEFIVALRNAAPALFAAARELAAAKALAVAAFDDSAWAQRATYAESVAREAQAALARVTDERLLERMRHDLELAGRWDEGYADVEAGLDTILATIRAVAGEGQEAGA